MTRGIVSVLAALAVLSAPSGSVSAPPARQEAAAGLEKALAFFCGKVAVQGGYVWQVSADLAKREGEGKVGPTTVWVQPPATPTVGLALVDIHAWTGRKDAFAAARATAHVLVRGQMRSGGWIARIDLDPARRRRYAYRVGPEPSSKARTWSSLDDDQTQAALRCLTRFDQVTAFKDKTVHEAARFGLDSLVKAQFPNGGWPHVFRGPPDPAKFPVTPASYSPTAQYTRIKAHWDLYTINDNLMSDVIDTLLLAGRVYSHAPYRQAALKGGDFLLLAQMPDPQPAWAQQYDVAMRPAWARKFEPPAISGGESQSVMRTLLDLYEQTGQRKYLAAVSKALAYFKRSLLPDGKLARFYELKTNRPLYFTRDYTLTYSDADMPTHYAFKVSSGLGSIERRLKALSARPWRAPSAPSGKPSRPSPQTIRRILDAMDARGAWVEDGRLRYWGKSDPTRRVIRSATFARNARLLAAYIAGR